MEADPSTTSRADQQELDREIDRWVAIDGTRIQRGVRLVGEPIIDRLLRLRTYGIEHIPASGPAMLCPNHASYLDPFIHARGLPRLVRFMAKSQLFDWPVVGPFIRGGGGFPIRRGAGDVFALSLAQRLLEDGQLVCVYPEGTRFRDHVDLGPARTGAARLVVATGVRVVPVASWGNKPRPIHGQRRYSIPRFTTVYGPPVDCADLFEPGTSSREAVASVRDRIWDAVSDVYRVAEQLHYAQPAGSAIPSGITFAWNGGAPRDANVQPSDSEPSTDT